MKRRTAALLVIPMLVAVGGCGSSSAPGSSVFIDTTINGRRAPDANGNNRDQPIQTEAPSVP
jgi:hypothetical protein